MSKALKKKRTGEGKRLTPVPLGKFGKMKHGRPKAMPYDTMRFEVKVGSLDMLIGDDAGKLKDVVSAIRKGIVEAVHKVLGADLGTAKSAADPFVIKCDDRDVMHSEVICADLS